MIWLLAQASDLYSPEYVKRLQQKADNFETLFYFLILLTIFLFLAVVYQFLKIRKLSSQSRPDSRYRVELPRTVPPPQKPNPNLVPSSSGSRSKATGSGGNQQPTQNPKNPVPSEGIRPTSKDLPDPGLIYKYAVHGDTPEKVITIGQKEGTIITYSTEIVDHHLTIMIRPIDSSRNRDIYDLPDKIVEEYVVDFRRGGKIIYNLPNSTQIEEMGARMRVYIKPTPDEAGDPTFGNIDAAQPIRFRLGDRLTQEGKFRAGYFEFHFYTKDHETTTKAGIPCIEKSFFVKLFKIYPGYDTASQNEDGLFPMVDPFAKR